MVRKSLAIPFPRNLICDVLGREVTPEEMPSDIDESIEHVLEHSMSERDAFILVLRYLHNLSFWEIAAYYGLSYGCIRQIIKKALRRLRHPRYRKYLQDGCAKVEQKAVVVPEKQIHPMTPADP